MQPKQQRLVFEGRLLPDGTYSIKQGSRCRGVSTKLKEYSDIGSVLGLLAKFGVDDCATVFNWFSDSLVVHDRCIAVLDDVRGEEAVAPEFGCPQGQRPHAGRLLPLAEAVPAVDRGAAELVGLGAHDLVGEQLGHRPDELLQVDGAVCEPGQRLRRGGRGGHAL